MKCLVLVDDREVMVGHSGPSDAYLVEPGVYSVLWNGQSIQVRIKAQRTGYRVEIGGKQFSTEVRDPRNSAGRSKAALAGGRQSLSASMPGKVIRVLVEEGQQIEPGQGLIVVEAMKMQNEMKAAKAGRVAKVHVAAGQTVAAGDVLITVE